MNRCVKNTAGKSTLEKVTYTLKELNKMGQGEDRKFSKAILMFLQSRAFTCVYENEIFKKQPVQVAVYKMEEGLLDFITDTFDLNFEAIY